MREWLAQNGPVDKEDLERHDKWLCMMWPRLHLLKELLSDDGVIFVSIDDNEQHHLRMLLDEIFGAENFVTNIVWQKKSNPQNDAKYFSDNHDFVLCYAKNVAGDVTWKRNLMPRTERQDARYKYDDDDGRGPWAPDNLSVKTYSTDYDYPITNPKTGQVHYPPHGGCWRANQQTTLKWITENRIYFGKSGEGRPTLKRYLSKVKQGIVPLTVWTCDDTGDTASAYNNIKEIFLDSDRPFENPKPPTLIDRILRIATGPDDIILDSFAGSGTTAHAVLALNRADGGNRRFILVECEDYADRITAERVRRVIQGVPSAKDPALREGLGGSFTYYTLGEPVDLEAILTGESLPSFPMLAAYLLHTGAGVSSGAPLERQNADGLFYADEKNHYHLIYEPDLAFLRSNGAVLNEKLARRINQSAQANGKKAVVFAAGKYMGQRELSRLGITFCQLPYEIYRGDG